jgi:small subunit ribosomal protein S9
MSTKVIDNKYYEAVGRRKTAIARVRLFLNSANSFVINDKTLETYFPVREMRMIASEALKNSKVSEKFKVSVKVYGGGLASQAEAMRHGIARALIKYDILLRGQVKKLGYLKRDPRAKERRKFGLKKARKSAQWSKR